MQEIKERFNAPANTGRRYAGVSGDYNPHHLYTGLARLFGFKQVMAHGMWSLARAVAGLSDMSAPCRPAQVSAFFKLPVFLPAALTLGAAPGLKKENSQPFFDFELRDANDGRPHLKGVLTPLGSSLP